MTRRGQLLALAATVLAVLLLAALANYRTLTPEPQLVLRRDWAQAATLATLGRAWIVFASEKGFFCPLFIGSTSRRLLALNETYRLNIPYLLNETRLGAWGNNVTGGVSYRVYIYRPWRGGWVSYVNVTVRAEYAFNGTYIKEVGGEETLYKRYRLHYYHLYEGPWGTLRVCDLELRPEEPVDVDIEYLGGCEWLIGFPASMGSITLLDKFRVRVGVGWTWNLRP